MSVEETVVTLASSRMGEAEIAADLKKRFEDSLTMALQIMDEANRAGLAIQFDGIAMAAPLYRHRVLNLRVVKQY